MSDYIDETSLTDEEVAAAIAEAKARKAARAKQASEEKPEPEKAKTLDKESSDALLDASSSAAELEEEENESPAVRSAKSFSEAFAAAKKKRELDLLKKKEEAEEEAEEEADEDETEESEEEFEEEEAVFEADDEEDYEDEEEESDEDDEESEDEDDESDDEDDEDYDDEDEDDDDLSGNGIFETDDENGEYNTTVSVDEDDEGEYDEDEDDEDDDEGAFSKKTKIIIGIVIAVLVIAIIAAFAFFMKGKGGDNDTSSVASVVDGEIKSVKFAEPSVSLEVGETVSLKLIVEPENAKDKTFKLKSNDETIVKVNEQGQITGISSGSTTVTATLKSNPTMTASLVVNVIDEEQSTLNIYNKFVNAIIDGSTDIDSDSETDSEEGEDQEETDTENAEENSDSDTDSEAPKKKATHRLTGNKIDDFDSDGELELALYYEPTTDNEEPLVRIFHLVDEDAVEDETDSEEELQYDEYGNPIESDTESEAPESKAAADSDKSKKKSPAEKTLTEVEQYSELYMTLHTALEADAASEPWNTSYLEVKENETVTTRVKILSSGYGAPTYTYESEDEEIATVDKQGNIKGLKPGTVIVTVSSPLNSDAVAKVKIRVKDDTDLLDDYLADIPVVNNTNDAIFPTETLIGKAITDIDGDGISELLLRFRYSDNVETVNIIKIENEKCICYKTYNNLSDLYEYEDGEGSYSNSVLVHYTTGKVCLEYKSTVAKSGSKSRSTEEKIFTLENGGSLSELVNFRTTTDISTKTVTSEATVDNNTSSRRDDYEDEETDSEYEEESDEDTSSTSSYIDEDEDGYDDITGEYFGSYAAEDGDVDSNTLDLTHKTPVKKLPEVTGAPEDEEEDYYDGDDENDYEEDDEPTTSTVTTEVSEETTKYFVNGTPTEKSVYEEILTRYSSTYSVWNAWESVY